MANTIPVDEESKIPMLDIVGRTAIYVFYSSYKHVRQLNSLGDIVYSSKKARYALLYVDTDRLDDILLKLKTLHFVQEVKVSQFDNLDRDFSSAFLETVNVDKKTVDA